MTTPPVIDTDALGRLREQLGDPEIMRGFLRRYESMLEQRLERLQHALDAQDHDDWMDAVLSLKTSSAMAGATALAHLSAELQDCLTKRPPEAVRWPMADGLEAVMAALRHLARETAQQLRSFLERMSAQARPC